MTSAWGREAFGGEGEEDDFGVAAGGGGEEVAVGESLSTSGDFLGGTAVGFGGGAVELLFIDFSIS